MRISDWSSDVCSSDLIVTTQQGSSRGMSRADIFEFFRRLAELDPDPQTELEYGNTYQLLVAVVLSAQATDVGVNKATRKLFEAVKTPQQMADLGEAGLKNHKIGRAHV